MVVDNVLRDRNVEGMTAGIMGKKKKSVKGMIMGSTFRRGMRRIWQAVCAGEECRGYGEKACVLKKKF